MIVMKFGGTSVGNATRIQGVFEIVSARKHLAPLVVVSAVGGVTDLLIEAGLQALAGNIITDTIFQKHNQIIKDLSLPPELVQKEHALLASLLTGIKMIGEISPKTSDLLVSFGERISCQLVAAHFRQSGLPAQAHFAYDIGMLTDHQFLEARPLPEAYAQLHEHISKMDYIPIITGFLGKTPQGQIATLGRGGSDYTAAIIGAAVQAEEIQIWTDVDGILTTDPRMVSKAKNVPVVSFKEAAEMAYFGAKVLHPKTIRPAMDHKIPVVVKNTANPSHEGTRILPKAPKTHGTVKAISFKKNVSLIHIFSLRMLDAYGFLARIFNIFAKYKVAVDVVSTSEVSVSLTVDDISSIESVLKELSDFAQIRIEHHKSIICIVGEGMREESGIVGIVFQAIAKEQIPVQMISQGASDVNLTFLVDQIHMEKTVKALHSLFFET